MSLLKPKSTRRPVIADFRSEATPAGPLVTCGATTLREPAISGANRANPNHDCMSLTLAVGHDYSDLEPLVGLWLGSHVVLPEGRRGRHLGECGTLITRRDLLTIKVLCEFSARTMCRT